MHAADTRLYACTGAIGHQARKLHSAGRILSWLRSRRLFATTPITKCSAAAVLCTGPKKMIYRKYDRLRTSGRSRLSPFSAVSGYTRITDGNEDWLRQCGANGATASLARNAKDHLCKRCKSDEIFVRVSLAVSLSIVSTDTGLSLC